MKQVTRSTITLLLTLALLLQMLPALALDAEPVDESRNPSEQAQSSGETEEGTAADTEPGSDGDEPDEVLTAPEEVLTEPEEVLTEPEEILTEPEEALTEPAALPDVEADETVTQARADALDGGGEETAVPALPEEQEVEEGVSLPDDGTTNEELLERYLYQTAQSELAPPKRLRSIKACTRLDPVPRVVAVALEDWISELAAGNESYTQKRIVIKDITGKEGYEFGSWNAAELGLDELIVDGKVTDTAKKACASKIQSQMILSAILTDLPYELYWFDTTYDDGNRKAFSFSVSVDKAELPVGEDSGETEYRLYISAVTVRMVVAEAYAAVGDPAPHYYLNTELCQSAKTAAGRAADVVAEKQGLPDYEKLAAYRDAICERVSYNSTAAHDDTVPYGNPWQLIWVFDDNPETNVVCEGYSKAFQFLCDLSTFRAPITCISVRGRIPEGGHMWNIVTMGDGLNYLVDVTNCDGNHDREKLFLAGCTSGSVSAGFICGGRRYTYSSTTKDFFSGDELTITDHRYRHLARCTITLDEQSFVYDGSAKTPAVTVSDSGTPLTEDVDYEVTYAGNVNAGENTASAIITAIGAYDGVITRTFSITPISLADSTVTVEEQSFVYDGSAKTPAVTVSDADTPLTRDVDYVVTYAANIDAGENTASVTITGIGNYSGELSRAFSIARASLEEAQVTCPAQTYTGKALTPAPTVKLGEKTLRPGVDYTVTWQNNVDAGTADMLVEGAGNYTGTATGSFTIDKAKQTLTVSCAGTVIVGRTIQVTGKGVGALSYASGDKTVAAVSARGVITGKKYGSTTITVTAAGDRNHESARKTVKVNAVCDVPKMTKVENVNGGVKITWGKVSGAVAYRVFYKNSAGCWTGLGNTKATSFVSTRTNVSGKTYTFTVRCVSALSYGTWTSGYDKTGKSIRYLAPPTFTKLKSYSRRSISGYWTGVSGATGYQIQYSTSKSFDSDRKTSAVTATKKTLTSLTRGKVYYFRVRSYRKSGSTTVYSAWSGVRSLKCS